MYTYIVMYIDIARVMALVRLISELAYQYIAERPEPFRSEMYNTDSCHVARLGHKMETKTKC